MAECAPREVAQTMSDQRSTATAVIVSSESNSGKVDRSESRLEGAAAAAMTTTIGPAAKILMVKVTAIPTTAGLSTVSSSNAEPTAEMLQLEAKGQALAHAVVVVESVLHKMEEQVGIGRVRELASALYTVERSEELSCAVRVLFFAMAAPVRWLTRFVAGSGMFFVDGVKQYVALCSGNNSFARLAGVAFSKEAKYVGVSEDF